MIHKNKIIAAVCVLAFCCGIATIYYKNHRTYYVPNVIVGAGLSGVTMAERIATYQKEKVLIIEKRDHVGGNVYDYKDENGITVQKYGIHAFHTNNEKVWRYLSQFTNWHNYRHRALAETSKGNVNFPVNLNTIKQLFDKDFAAEFSVKLINKYGMGQKISISDLQNSEDTVLQQGAQILYEELFKNYTIKQWGMSVDEVDPSVIARVPVYLNYENAYFTDKYQGIPEYGYTSMIKTMLSNPLIEVRLNTNWEDVKDKIKYDKLFFSGSIDTFFDYKFGKLPYRSLRFDIVQMRQEFYQDCAQVNHANHPSMTRSIEHKYILDENSPQSTTVSFEYPEAFDDTNERYYPINKPENAELYAKYQQEADKLKNVYFFGRLGDYKYYNMDQAVERALDLYDKVFVNQNQ